MQDDHMNVSSSCRIDDMTLAKEGEPMSEWTSQYQHTANVFAHNFLFQACRYTSIQKVIKNIIFILSITYWHAYFLFSYQVLDACGRVKQWDMELKLQV